MPTKTAAVADTNGNMGLLESLGLQADVDIAIEVLPLAELFIDDRFQRELNQKRVEKIVGDFDSKMVGVPVVNRRSPGRYSVCDGQHRIAALRMLDREFAVCQVVAIPEKDEALLFVDLQHSRKDVKAAERHHALVFAGHDEAITIERILKQHGFVITDQYRWKVGGTVAVRALYSTTFGSTSRAFPVWGKSKMNGSADALRFVLSTIRDAWGLEADHASRGNVMFRGLSAFYSSTIGSDFNLDRDHLLEALSGQLPRVIVNRGSGRKQLGERGTPDTLTAREIADVYNKGLRGPKKIDPGMIGR